MRAYIILMDKCDIIQLLKNQNCNNCAHISKGSYFHCKKYPNEPQFSICHSWISIDDHISELMNTVGTIKIDDNQMVKYEL